MGAARFGDTPLPPPFPAGVFTGHQPQIAHQLAGRLQARELSQFGNQGNGRGELDPAQRLDRFHHWRPAPGLD